MFLLQSLLTNVEQKVSKSLFTVIAARVAMQKVPSQLPLEWQGTLLQTCCKPDLFCHVGCVTHCTGKANIGLFGLCYSLHRKGQYRPIPWGKGSPVPMPVLGTCEQLSIGTYTFRWGRYWPRPQCTDDYISINRVEWIIPKWLWVSLLYSQECTTL